MEGCHASGKSWSTIDTRRCRRGARRPRSPGARQSRCSRPQTSGRRRSTPEDSLATTSAKSEPATRRRAAHVTTTSVRKSHRKARLRKASPAPVHGSPPLPRPSFPGALALSVRPVALAQLIEQSFNLASIRRPVNVGNRRRPEVATSPDAPAIPPSAADLHPHGRIGEGGRCREPVCGWLRCRARLVVATCPRRRDGRVQCRSRTTSADQRFSHFVPVI
jgi:hypothetical protein